MSPPVALTIAGSDSGGGAGIQADLRTFAAFGVFGTSAITAITAQNTVEVRAVHPLPVELVRAQVEAVLDDLPVAAVKTGMLPTAAAVDLVADLATAGRLPHLVVDPVLVSSSGARLVEREVELRHVARLLPLASVFTPNLHEAGVLLGRTLRTSADQRDAARALASMTGGVVVVTGGHATTDAGELAIDVVAGGGLDTTITRRRVDTVNSHGTGCSFASAIAAGLAAGVDVGCAIRSANHFVHGALAGAARWNLGSGAGPLDHFSWEER